jgi:ABC-type glycerol-3-phosphate transport system substrate-binding protein
MRNLDTGERSDIATHLRNSRIWNPSPYLIRWIRSFVFLLLLALSACTPATVTTEPVNLVFAFPEGIMDNNYYESLAAQFTALYPHITIRVAPNDWEAADVLLGPEWVLRQAQSENQLVSLDAFIEQEKSFDLQDFYPSTIDQLTIEGEIWALPAGVEMALLFYNRDLFDTYRVPYPETNWTWADFLNTALALRHPEVDVFGYVPWGGDLEYLDSIIFIYQHGGKIIDDWQSPTSTTFDDPLTLEALEWYAGLFQEYEVAPTPAQVSQAFMGLTDVSIASGKAGMWIDSLVSQGQVGREWDFALGITSLPHDTHSITLAWVYGYAISAPATHRQESWQWIEFLSDQISTRLAPARISSAESIEYAQLMGNGVIPIRASLAEASMISYWTLFTRFSGEMRQFQSALEQIVKGEATPSELFDVRP